MNDTHLTYTAIITITLPDQPHAARIVVTLAPSDQVPVAGDRLLPLRDCTLADLQQYAERVEQGIGADYEAIRLLDLTEEETARVKITLLNETAAQLSDDWRQHALVKPFQAPEVTPSTMTPLTEEGATAPDDEVGQEATDGEGEAVPSEMDDGRLAKAGEQEAAPDTTMHADEEPAESSDEADAEDTESGMAPAVIEAAVALEEEPVVNVAETEPVHAEREADLLTVSVARPGELRVAGRRQPVGQPTWAAVDILIDEPAFRNSQAHALSSLEREVAGVLVGPPPEKQPDGRYVVHITDTIIARHTRMQGASVTYTPESWRYLNDQLAERFPDESAIMVGWYHTHPGFGIFLSGMDLFIHQNFFTQIWHVALVLDPLARRSGFFCWDRQQSRVSAYQFSWPSWANNSW